MARQIADNLSYKGPKPLDNRLVVQDLSDLANFNENFCYDGMKVYVARRSAFYVYDSRNENAGTSMSDIDAIVKWRKGEDALHAKTEWRNSEDILPEGEGDPNIKMLEHRWYLELSRNKQTVLIFDNHAYSYITEVEGYNKDDEPCTYLIYQCTCTNVQTGLKPDDELSFAARVLEISSETMYKTGIQYHYAYHRTVSMGGGGDGDLAKRLSNLGKENRIAATDKDDFYGLLWDIDMSKYSTSSSSRPTETRVLECVEYVPTSSGTVLTEAVGGVATVTEVVTPTVSGEWDSYIFIEFRPHEFTKYSQTTFIRRIAVQFDSDKVGQFSKGVIAFDLSADTGWITTAVAGDVTPDNKTIEKNPQGKLQVKNEGITKSKINSEAGVVFADDTQELKNKTIDATKNTFKNLSLTAFGDNLLDKNALTTTDDNHIATSKLIKNYADTKIAIPSTRATKIMAWNSSGNTKVLSYQKQYEHFFAVKRTSYNVNYITFRYLDTTAAPTNAQMIKWLYDHGFTSQNALYPAAGLAASNTIYVASTSGGETKTQFSATSCINGIFSPDGINLKYTYRSGTDVSIDAARITRITSIDRGYIITD